MRMSSKTAWLYAATWGSYIRAGDPGACMYGFDESFILQHEGHRAECLAEMERNRAAVVAKPGDYDADELVKLDSFVETLTTAPTQADVDSLDEFTGGYIEAAFWTENAPGVSTEEWQADDDHDEGSIPGDVGLSDMAPRARAAIVADCLAFQADNAALLAEAYATGYSAARAGHDYWLTRNGHGAGYWDRTELEPEGPEYERLTTIMNNAGDDRDAWGKALAARNVIKESGIGERLTRAAKAQGEEGLYLGDDGLVYT